MITIFDQIRKRLQAPSWASWQTFVSLSVFSVIVAGMTNPPIQAIIANFGWVFLVIGVWWFTYDETVKKKLTFNGLFTGAVDCRCDRLSLALWQLERRANSGFFY